MPVKKALKSTMSTTWFVRIDGEEEYLRPKVLLFATSLDVVSMLSTAHTGKTKENPHMHAVIQMANEVQKQSFAIRIKKHFEVVDRGYALDVWDGRKAEYGAGSYLFHETPAHVLVHKGWTTPEITEAQRIAAITGEAVAEAKEKASTKFVEKALKYFEGKHPSQYHIFEYLMQLVASKDMYWPGTFKSKQMVEEVEIKMTENIGHLTQIYFNSIFR